MFLLIGPGTKPPLAPGTIGTLKDELESAYPGKGARIVRWACTGAKSYSAVIVDRHGNILDHVIKMKGITLQSRINLDHDRIAELVTGGQPFQVPQTQFKKSIVSHSVCVNDVHKKVSFTSDKRVIVRDSEMYDTLPYGFC